MQTFDKGSDRGRNLSPKSIQSRVSVCSNSSIVLGSILDNIPGVKV